MLLGSETSIVESVFNAFSTGIGGVASDIGDGIVALIPALLPIGIAVAAVALGYKLIRKFIK